MAVSLLGCALGVCSTQESGWLRGHTHWFLRNSDASSTFKLSQVHFKGLERVVRTHTMHIQFNTSQDGSFPFRMVTLF